MSLPVTSEFDVAWDINAPFINKWGQDIVRQSLKERKKENSCRKTMAQGSSDELPSVSMPWPRGNQDQSRCTCNHCPPRVTREAVRCLSIFVLMQTFSTSQKGFPAMSSDPRLGQAMQVASTAVHQYSSTCYPVLVEEFVIGGSTVGATTATCEMAPLRTRDLQGRKKGSFLSSVKTELKIFESQQLSPRCVLHETGRGTANYTVRILPTIMRVCTYRPGEPLTPGRR